jgi:hypothetical protein
MLARSLGCRLFRVSVKEDVNVGPVFRHLAACCLEEMHAEEEAMGMGGYQPPAISEYEVKTEQAVLRNFLYHFVCERKSKNAARKQLLVLSCLG